MKSYQKAFTGILLPLLFLVISNITFAQKSNRSINDTEKKEIIEKVFEILKERYIFPEKIPHLQKIISGKLAEGYYKKFLSAENFLDHLNTDLETLTNDRHVNLFFDPIVVKQIETSEKDTTTQPAFTPQFLKRAKFENFMVRNVERLEGNVGYFKFNMFIDLAISKPTFVSAMNVLTHSDALIFDLRQNGGGHSITCDFLLSYFLPDSTKTGTFTARLNNTKNNIYTTYDPLIKKFTSDIPLFILTSKKTSSAAEAFAYILQASKRATIIGDTTKGEANPGYRIIVNPEMYIMVPTSINRNAITNTNWQGIGVIPDINIGQDKALIMAQAMAYKQLGKSTNNNDLRFFYEWKAIGMESELKPVKIPAEDLKSYAGNYADDRIINQEEGILFYQRSGSTKKRLIPITPDTFSLEGSPFFRIRFIKSSGVITALEGMYDDGIIEASKRIN